MEGSGLDLVEVLDRYFALRTAASKAETSGQPRSQPVCGPKTSGTQV